MYNLHKISLYAVKNHLLIIFLFISEISFAQTQNIRGVVFDQTSKTPLISVNIETDGIISQSDSLGRFVLNKIPIGRKVLKITHVGYESYQTEAFILNSTKEINLEIALRRSSILLKEVTITAKSTDPVNNLAYTSTRSFTADETERIPASVNDPARMALSYMGVRGGRKDADNQLVIRGNSPTGVLWRVEGVDIPSPNHFTVHGAASGGITVFSAALIDQSDFSIGGMSAEYGNGLAGAFDIRLRQGNQQKQQYKAKIGFLGIDFSAEGPIKKGFSSYVINYRYSTLGLLNKMHLYIGDVRSITTFQDLSFNVVFRSKNYRNRTNFYSVGGMSYENTFPVEDPTKRQAGVWDDWEDRWRISDVGIVGVNHNRTLNTHSSIKIGLALVGSNIRVTSDSLGLDNEKFSFENQKYIDKRLVGAVHYQNQINDKTFLKIGTMNNFLNFSFLNEFRPRYFNFNPIQFADRKQTLTNGMGSTMYSQLYAQMVYDLTTKLTINAGFHFLYFALNQKKSFEPRISTKYQLNPKSSLSFTYGLYSQILTMSTYFNVQKKEIDGQTVYEYPNRNMDFPRSHHFILGYRIKTRKDFKFVGEAYFQAMRKVLILPFLNSNYWSLNSTEGYPNLTFQAKGTGKNYGIDVSLEKLFVKTYYLMINASVFDASYRTLDDIDYISNFANRFGTSLTFGREFTFKNKAVLQIGARGFLNGGFRYSPADVESSIKYQSYVPIIPLTNTLKAPTYFRMDGRISYRVNKPKIASILSVDIQNLTNRQNYSKVDFNQVTKALQLQRKSGGLVPVLSYQVDF